ncbi:MAG: hypothetical protein JXR77_10305, partial [Lentisphaeria bacterium]|nr:hypothetical protein [Lentisphaeria bacterium]
ESTAAVPAADRRRIEFAYDPPSSPVAHFAVAKWTRTADLDRVSVDDGQAHPATVLQNGTWAASRAKGSGRPDQLE